MSMPSPASSPSTMISTEKTPPNEQSSTSKYVCTGKSAFAPSKQTLMGFVFTAQGEVSIRSLRAVSNGLLSLEPGLDIGLFLRSFSPLLTGVDKADDPVSPLHTSFPEFIRERSRSKDFGIGSASALHGNLAIASLRLLKGTNAALSSVRTMMAQ
ncbi:hypothetical protein CALVIDRAFT_286045 [Calocera viscosa TUFC12733]|uniref:Uncharacterized protein n=1 Tax=Calocera viscosa (strain TUFC12733) TaxID=1330018 RepID=A0A167IUT5_CALVF|nr:hypothetical protein CALVIDRAFT_286045 [Calocera viscosa TUFC12733]